MNDKILPKCPECGQDGNCYFAVIAGGDPSGASDITKFFFVCPHCHHTDQTAGEGDWEHHCSFCHQKTSEHEWLPDDLGDKFPENK
jgi:hypothetical protein